MILLICTVSPSVPLNASLATLNQYDVVVLDPPTCKGLGWQFIITEDSKEALSQYLKNGGKIVASAYLFVYWNPYTSWERMLYNEDVSILLFNGAKPDINTYSPSAITNSPLAEGENILTLNAASPGISQPNDPYFHFFWKLEIPVVEATIRIEPETLNLKSKGVFTAFIMLPEGYDGSDIDINTVECEGASAVRGNIVGKTLIVKFNREDLVGLLPGEEVPLTITGSLANGMLFSGTDKIRLIMKGK